MSYINIFKIPEIVGGASVIFPKWLQFKLKIQLFGYQKSHCDDTSVKTYG